MRARHSIHLALDAQPPLSAGTLRVLLAVLQLTVGWSKPVDRTVRKVIATRAGVSTRTVTRGLERLGALGAVVWTPARATGQFGTLALPETTNCPECLTEHETPNCPESDGAPETESTATRDRIDRDARQLDVSLPRGIPQETAGESRVGRLLHGLRANHSHSQDRVEEQDCAKAVTRALDEYASSSVDEAIAHVVANGYRWPSDLGKRLKSEGVKKSDAWMIPRPLPAYSRGCPNGHGVINVDCSCDPEPAVA